MLRMRTGPPGLRTCAAILAAALVTGMAVSASAQAPARDPAAALKEINTWFAGQLKQAQDQKTAPDRNVLMAERLKRAKEAVAGMDPAKTDPAKCLDLAQLYQMAQMPKEMAAAASRFADTASDPEQKFQAQQLMVVGSAQTDDAAGIVRAVDAMKPTTPRQSYILAQYAAGPSDTVAEKLGAPAALEMLQKAEKRVDWEALKKYDAEQAAKNTGPNARAMSLHDAALASLAGARADILQSAGKKDEARAVLEQAVKQLGPDNRMAQSLESKLRLARLPGSMAPELKVDRKIGDFTSLAALRGKVVLLDFTAHW